jgi:hypothetical protein
MYYWVVMMREFFTGVNRFREQMRLNIRRELASPPASTAAAPVTERARPQRASL